MEFVLDQCLHANGNKWMSVLVVLCVDMCVCGQVGVRSGLTEEKELLFDLWEKLPPEVDWHGWGASAEDSDEMVLEGLYGFFRHVASVFLGGNYFIGHAGCINGGLVLR